ncbi:MAG: aminoacyl-histidine dipeptidase [Alistipes sp.]|nr:aminoacyl-histidine dipeptidase [Alistipes sp.]
MATIRDLQPQLVWELFDDITRVPRPSKHEEQMTAFLEAFAAKHGIECHKDRIGNVVMRKPATKGYEGRPTVILQAHTDMVCEKNSDVKHDFFTDPIRTRIVDGWVMAEGTTLGADCGIGVAAALAVMVDPAVEHGPVEALFTVDEETGLTGAFNLGEGMISGKYLINLDSEDDGELFIGCAGGVDTLATFKYKREAAPADYLFYRVDVSGLTGGHSGDDIDKGRANSNKLLARLLVQAQELCGVRLSTFDGGNLRNAIPREAYAVVAVPPQHNEAFENLVSAFAADVKEEFRFTEPSLRLTLAPSEPAALVDDASQRALLAALVGLPNGVLAMSFALPGLVETSTNLASVKFSGEDTVVVTTSQRSSLESAKLYAKESVASVFRLAGAEVEHSDGYPGWTPNPQSNLLEWCKSSYLTLFGVEPKVRAIHAGLECGLFLEKYPHLEMVSFGPTLRGVHSPDERIEIATVDKFWRLLLDVLRRVE